MSTLECSIIQELYPSADVWYLQGESGVPRKSIYQHKIDKITELEKYDFKPLNNY